MLLEIVNTWKKCHSLLYSMW